ncbi:MAG: hypothetical protein Q8P13_00980 [bacterium]|nr:hypothetical protein [bacterium]
MPNLADLTSKAKEKLTLSSNEEVVVAEKYEGSDKVIACLAYVYFVSAAVLLLRHDNSEFVRFHAKQAFVLLIIALLVLLIAPGTWKYGLNGALFLVALYGAVRAFQGRRWTVPYFTSIANSIEI